MRLRFWVRSMDWRRLLWRIRLVRLGFLVISIEAMMLLDRFKLVSSVFSEMLIS